MFAVQDWQPGQRHTHAKICCCPDCGATEIFRRGSSDGAAYWRCSDCGSRWRENLNTGLGKRCNAKGLRLIGMHEAGTSRRLAEVRCCEACGNTHVRRTSTVGRIGYWTCLGCSHGWTQVVEDVGSGLKVKLPQAPRILQVADSEPLNFSPMAAAAG